MAKNHSQKYLIFFLFFSLIISVSAERLKAQSGIQGTQPHKIKWISVNALRSWFDNFGSEGEFFRRDRTTYVAQDQIDGLCRPNEYNARMKGVGMKLNGMLKALQADCISTLLPQEIFRV